MTPAPDRPRTPPSTDDPLHAALGMLERTRVLAASLPPREFTVPHPLFGNSTIGQHVRHCLDHFACLVAGLDARAIDYDARERGTPIETDPGAAAELAARLAADLARASLGLDAPVSVRIACAVSGRVAPQVSTFGRELQFVVGHTVHHFAILAAQCRSLGIAVDDEFGVAPSTLRFRQACATSR